MAAVDSGLRTRDSAGLKRETGNTSGWAGISLIRDMDPALSRGMTGKELRGAPRARALLRNDLNRLPLRPAQVGEQIDDALDQTKSRPEPGIDLDVFFG